MKENTPSIVPDPTETIDLSKNTMEATVYARAAINIAIERGLDSLRKEGLNLADDLLVWQIAGDAIRRYADRVEELAFRDPKKKGFQGFQGPKILPGDDSLWLCAECSNINPANAPWCLDCREAASTAVAEPRKMPSSNGEQVADHA